MSEIKNFTFPTGERHYEVGSDLPKHVDVEFEFTGSDSIIDLILKCNAYKNAGVRLRRLVMPYVPFSRQDRVTVTGASFSLQAFAEILNSFGFEEVVVHDPHSDVTAALIKNINIVEQWQIFFPYLEHKKDFYLICPDGGALKKIYKLAKFVEAIDVIECSKKRDLNTGEIKKTIVHASDLQWKNCYIVDDICDGGRTFIEIAKILKTLNCGKITLMVTHGFFTNGLAVFDGLIDHIITRKGWIK